MNAVELLLDYPMADINTIDADGQTCFHHLAMLTGNSDLTTANEATELLQHILDGEMDPHLNAQDNYGYTPLHIAVSHGSIEAVALLLSCGGVDINQTDHGGSTPLDHYTAANTDTLSSVVAEGSNEMAFHNLLDVPTSDKVEQVNDMMEILQNHNPPALSLNLPPNFSLSLSFGHLKKNCHLTSLPNCFLPTSLPNFPLLFRVPTYVLLLPCPAFFLFIPLLSSLDGRRR